MRVVYQLGGKLRQVREQKGLTLKQAARSAGVSESLVSQIERDRVSPSLDTLFALVKAVGVDIDYLFKDFKRPGDISIIKKSDRKRISEQKVDYEQITVINGDKHDIEAFVLKIQEGGRRGSSEYGHPGREFGLILSGDAVIEYAGREYRVSSGDSVSFSSDMPHVLKNEGSSLLKAVWVSSPPRMLFRTQ